MEFMYDILSFKETKRTQLQAAPNDNDLKSEIQMKEFQVRF